MIDYCIFDHWSFGLRNCHPTLYMRADFTLPSQINGSKLWTDSVFTCDKVTCCFVGHYNWWLRTTPETPNYHVFGSYSRKIYHVGNDHPWIIHGFSQQLADYHDKCANWIACKFVVICFIAFIYSQLECWHLCVFSSDLLLRYGMLNKDRAPSQYLMGTLTCHLYCEN